MQGLHIRRASGRDFDSMLDITCRALRELAVRCYPLRDINEAISTGAWTLHREIIDDGNYFVVEASDGICGGAGWNTRHLGETATPVTSLPGTASLRAMFVDPRFAGRGVGSRLLQHCITDIQSSGFGHVELFASFNAEPLYRRHGFTALALQHLRLASGAVMTGVRMRRTLGSSSDNRDCS